MLLSIIRNLALMLTTLCVAGCQSPYIRMPNFAHPGTAAQQRADAERFDPYPDPEAGPPVVGGRPLGYTRPLTETEWSRRYVPPPLGVGQPAPIPFLPTSPIITNPFPSTAPPAYAPIYSPAYPPALPSPTTPTQIQPRNPY
jgi:hypothetical protein